MESFDPLDSEYIPNYFTYETVNLMNQDDVSVILYPGKIDEFTTEGECLTKNIEQNGCLHFYCLEDGIIVIIITITFDRK